MLRLVFIYVFSIFNWDFTMSISMKTQKSYSFKFCQICAFVMKSFKFKDSILSEKWIFWWCCFWNIVTSSINPKTLMMKCYVLKKYWSFTAPNSTDPIYTLSIFISYTKFILNRRTLRKQLLPSWNTLTGLYGTIFTPLVYRKLRILYS